jgi:hypothetical protein
MHLVLRVKGGSGSGNFGHEGRPGEVGGSAPGTGDRANWGTFDQTGPTIVYHGTTSDAVQSILDGGLHRGGEWMGRPKSVYFTTSKENAADWASSHASNYEYVIVAFEITDVMDKYIIPDMDMLADFPNWKSAFRIEKDISPKHIKYIEVGKISYDKLMQERDERGAYIWRSNLRLHPEKVIEKEQERLGYVVIFIDEPVEKQLPIDDEAKRRLFEARLGIFYSDAGSLAEDLFTGGLSLGDWEARMHDYIKEIYTSSGAIAKGGWGEMTQSDWGRIGAALKKQYKYLHGFAQDIAANRDNIALGSIQARANMYGNSAGYMVMLLSVDGDILSQLPWLPKDGSTECLTNCKCVWVCTIVNKKPDVQTVRAVWRLRPAEHCEDCADRSGFEVTFTVPSNIQVPKYIGGY